MTGTGPRSRSRSRSDVGVDVDGRQRRDRSGRVGRPGHRRDAGAGTGSRSRSTSASRSASRSTSVSVVEVEVDLGIDIHVGVEVDDAVHVEVDVRIDGGVEEPARPGTSGPGGAVGPHAGIGAHGRSTRPPVEPSDQAPIASSRTWTATAASMRATTTACRRSGGRWRPGTGGRPSRAAACQSVTTPTSVRNRTEGADVVVVDAAHRRSSRAAASALIVHREVEVEAHHPGDPGDAGLRGRRARHARSPRTPPPPWRSGRPVPSPPLASSDSSLPSLGTVHGSPTFARRHGGCRGRGAVEPEEPVADLC